MDFKITIYGIQQRETWSSFSIQTHTKYWQNANVRVFTSDNTIMNLFAWKNWQSCDLSGRGPKRTFSLSKTISKFTDAAIENVRQSLLEGSICLNSSSLSSTWRRQNITTKDSETKCKIFPFKIQIFKIYPSFFAKPTVHH